MSVPRLNNSTIEDIAITDFDRMTSTSGVALSNSSMGMVMSSSTSAVFMPMPSVWIATSGGANSGKTSTGMSGTRLGPAITNAVATATTRKRNLRLDAMIQCICVCREPTGLLPELLLDAQQQGRSDCHD